MIRRVLQVFLFSGFLFPGLLSAQSLPVGMPVLEDAFRREQLLGNTDPLISFTVRPLFTGISRVNPGISSDTTDAYNTLTKFSSNLIQTNKSLVHILPFNWQQQYNSEVPYGWNDGSIIPARGYQTRLSFGLFAKYGPLSVQLKPEMVYAENKRFDGLPTDHYDVVWAKYYDNYFNVTDIPERFGEDSFSRLLWGQSSIRLTFEPVSIGISNENLYWGPGIRSSLLMSNNAPGFKHITLNTTKPVVTPIGSFEAQMIAGRLENSGFTPPEINRVYQGRNLYQPKQDDWRYVSGFVLTFNPKGVPGLFIGASRLSQVYKDNAGSKIGDIIPLFQPFERKPENEEREYLSSMFFRWLWKDAGAEIYGEYGHNIPRKFKQFLLDPNRSAAYLVGLRKVVPFNKRREEFLQVGIELTEIQQTSIPEFGGWYTSKKIRHGFTNEGQVLGAGIGPGSNLQSLDISWFKGLKRIGFQVERYLHNNDLYYQIFQDSRDFRKHWVDMSYGLSADWDYKNLLFNARASMIRSLNYQYVLYNRPPEFFVPGWERINYQVNLGVSYRF